MERSLEQIAVEDLGAKQCVCGSMKKRQESFCRACYFALPEELRRRLYNTFSEGYAEIYDEAKDWLRIHTDRLRQSGLHLGGRP